MKRAYAARGNTLCLIFITAVTVPGRGMAEAKIALTGYDKAAYDSLNHLVCDPLQTFAVRPQSEWATALGTYRFESGTLAFLTTVGGQPTGCLFQGKGRFIFSPPSAIEREQLRRYCGDTVLDAALKQVYFRFFDSTLANALRECTGAVVENAPDRSGRLRKLADKAKDDLGLDIAAVGWKALYEPDGAPVWFYAAPSLKGQNRLHFLQYGAGREAVTLWRHPSGVYPSGAIDLVCSYDTDDPPDLRRQREGFFHEGIDITHYGSDVEIKGSGDMILDVTVHCRARHDSLSMLQFTMAPRLDIDSVLVGGEAAPYIYNKDTGALLVRSRSRWNTTDTFTLRIKYRGDRLLTKLQWGNFYIHHTTRWLPKTSLQMRSTYETAFRFPKHYDVVSVGEKTRDTLIGDLRFSTWRTYGPERFISFNFGSFERLTETMANGIELHIYRSKDHLDGLFTGDIKKRVAADIEGALRLAQQFLGPYPWDHLAVTEIPASHGQGFPQLLHLSWGSFQAEQKGYTEAFRAHEVSHQWFGHIVGWNTYHDQWLSEGFAEYFGALFLLVRFPGNDEFLKEIRRWRDRIMKKGGQGGNWHDGPQVAPIWLGYRCSSHQSPSSYQKLVYAKGAYVLHMLRQMMYDYERGSDRRFIAMMHDYIDWFAGKSPSTDDFRRVTESHLHQPMQWFFDQWIYGTQIPRFEYRWERGQGGDGRWTVRARIDQFDTSPPFKVFMPVTLKFDQGQRTFVQVVNGTTTEFEIPGLDQKPNEMVFNDYHSVLCKEKMVGKP